MAELIHYCGTCRRHYNLPQTEELDMQAGRCGVCGDVCWYAGCEELDKMNGWEREKVNRLRRTGEE